MKLAIVTGASRGIGREIALKLASCGFALLINCRKNSELLLQVKKEAEEFHVPCLTYVGDIGYYENAVEMFSLIPFDLSLDVLINNAGISHIGLLQDMDIKEWNNILQSNLTSVFNCSKLAIPHMLNLHEGKIINISSIWGVCGASMEVAYSATKGAINSFSKALAKELAPSNIQVNALALGVIDTEMNSFLDEEELAALKNEIPKGRLASTKEVADFIIQIINSPSYLTAQIITFDGGLL